MKKHFAALLVCALMLCALPACADTGENMQIVYDYITGTLGYNRAVACGIMSNIQYESNFRPNAIGDAGAAYGICQWNSRRQSLINYCERNGFESWQDIYGQLGYLGYELEHNKKKVGDYLSTLPDTPQGAYDAAYYFCVYFEIPAKRYEKGVKRGTTAVKKYFTMYGGTYETYTVRFDLNGGSGSFAAQTKIEGVPLTLPGDEPVRYGYAFAGWTASANGQSGEYQAGDSYTLNADIKLYALWTKLPTDRIGYESTNEGGQSVGYEGDKRGVSIPESIDGQTVRALRKGAFKNVDTVCVPETVTLIEEGAFEEGTLIVAAPLSCAHEFARLYGFDYSPAFPGDTLRLTGEVRVIEEEAFSGTGFTYVDFSQIKLERMEQNAFAGNQSLRRMYLPDTLTYIAAGAIPSQAAIMARPGSYAEKYAVTNGYRFVPIN